MQLRNALTNLVMILPMAFYSTPSPAPVEVLGGGDAVHCRAANGNALDGYYFLDYLVDYHNDQDQHFIAAEQAPETILATLRRNEARLLADSLAAFLESARSQLRDGPDFSANEMWVGDDLEDLQDENLYQRVPDNCKDPSNSRIVALKQAVVRTQRNDGVVFKYDRATLQDFAHKPMQLSFLLIHEWLWSHTEQSDHIRDLNRFLHQAASHTLGAGVFMQRLSRFGIHAGQFDWLKHITDTARAQAITRLQNLSACQFSGSADRTAQDWLLQNKSSLLQRLRGTVRWSGHDNISLPCVNWLQDGAGPSLEINSCYLEFTDIDRAKGILISTLAKSYGVPEAAAQLRAQVLWNQVNPQQTCH